MKTRVLLLVAWLPACGWFTEANPDYCQSDLDCHDSARPYCDLAGDDGVRNRCVESPFDAGPSCQNSSECTESGAPICSDDSHDCVPCTAVEDSNGACAAKDSTRPLCVDGACVAGCETSAGCPEEEPICDDSSHCVTCTAGAEGDADCAARDSDYGYCADDGSCVGCLSDDHCAGQTPVCDATSHSCRACASHAECESDICNPDGGCAETGAVIYVDHDLGSDSVSCGTEASPCHSIAGAQGGLSKVDGTHPYLHVAAGVYNESIAVDTGQTVILVGPGVTVSPQGSSNEPALLVGNGARVTVREASLTNATGGADADGVQCSGSSSTVVLDRVVVSGNQDKGVQVTGCGVTITRSRIASNGGGGISITDADFALADNFIVNNGDVSASIFGGVSIGNGVGFDQRFDFNTVARNQARGDATSSGVTCNTGTAMIASNSIVYDGFGDAPAISGGCGWVYSDVTGITEGTNGNLAKDPVFVDPDTGNFHLGDGSPCRDKADPASEVTVDYDGQVRPENGRADIGADEYYPPE